MNNSYRFPQPFRSDEAAAGSAQPDPTAQVGDMSASEVPSPEGARQQRMESVQPQTPSDSGIADPFRSAADPAGGEEGKELVDRFNQMLADAQPDEIPDLPGPSRAVPPAPNEGGE